jgi:hypothetical protein
MRRRRLAASFAAVGVAVATCLVSPLPATAARDAGVTKLSGLCPWAEGASKEVTTELRSGSLLAPYKLFDDKGWTGATLVPYEVLATGEGLKSRHLTPGTFTRKGAAPTDPVTCTFGGTTVDGDIGLQVVGTVRVQPKRPR